MKVDRTNGSQRQILFRKNNLKSKTTTEGNNKFHNLRKSSFVLYWGKNSKRYAKRNNGKR